MTTPRAYGTMTLLSNGSVLIAGGATGDTILDSAETFDPTTAVFAPTAPLNDAREFGAAVLLADGSVLIVGGDDGTVDLASAEIYTDDYGSVTPQTTTS